MKIYIRIIVLALFIFFLGYSLYSYQNELRSFEIDPHKRWEQLQPVSVFDNLIGSGLVSWSVAMRELYPMLTWYITFLGYWSWDFKNDFIFSYSGLVNERNCRIKLHNSYSWLRLTMWECHDIRNNKDWKVAMYMQSAIDHRGSQWRTITRDEKQFMFFFYPWSILRAISNVVSSELWKCTTIKCPLFIDKDLLYRTWSAIPEYISHNAYLEIWKNSALEIRDRSIDDGFVNGYVSNNAFELIYKRWWLFKKLMHVKWMLDSSLYSCILTIGKWLRRELILHRSGSIVSGSLVSSQGSSILIW